MATRRTRAFLLHVVLAVVAVMGSILLLFRATQRVRDGEVRLSTDEVVARCLARGAVETLTYYAELDLDQPLREPSMDLTAGRLHDAILDEPKKIIQLFHRRKPDDDQQDLAEQLFGEEAFKRLDELTQDSRGAQLSYQLDVEISPSDGYSVKDPVLKMIELGITVRCRFHHADQTYRGDVGIPVYTSLPHALSRFSLVMPHAGRDLNTLDVDAHGAKKAGPAPVVVFNRPGDYSPEDPLLGGAAAPAQPFTFEVAAAKTPASARELESAMAGRGAVYPSGDGGAPITLRLAAGDGPAGQAALIHPELGPGQPPGAHLLESQDPTASGPAVEGSVDGYWGGVDEHNLLGQPGAGEGSGVGTALVRPLGTGAHPSAGLVYGPAMAGLAAISNLAGTHDGTETFLKNIAPDAWDTERARLPQFPDYGPYARVMSKRLALPYNAALRAAGPSKGGSVLVQAAFGAVHARPEDDLLVEAHWRHTDPLHDRLGAKTPANKDYVDTRSSATWPLARLVAGFPGYPRFTQNHIQCKGVGLFIESFQSGGSLDLGGNAVELQAAREDQPPPSIDLGDAIVPAGGGGILFAPEVKLSKLKNLGEGAGFSPLVIVTPKLTLKGDGPFEGVFITDGPIVCEPTTTHTAIRGMLYAGSDRAFSQLAKPLALIWDPRMDATGPDAHKYYRGLVQWGAGPRISGVADIGGGLSDASTYRRPATRVLDAKERAKQPPGWVVPSK